jgi:NADH-quinone oxidoreductase subunit G
VEAGEDAVILAGPRLAESREAVWTAGLATRWGAKFALLCRRAGDRGALRAGVHPSLLPAGRSVTEDADRAVVEVAWGTLLPTKPGRDTAAILQAAAEREIGVLFLIGVDPLRDFPDAKLARRALENVPYKVVVDVSTDTLAIYADAMLPAAPFLEKDGHYSDWEGRSQRFRPVRNPHGLARSDWEIFQELSEVMEADMGFHSLEALHDEMGRLLAPHEAGAVYGRQPVRSPSARLTGAQTAYAPPPSPETREELVAGGQLILFSYSLLVDEGRLSVGADKLKEALEEPSFVEVHPDDADRLGLSDGRPARLRTAAGEAELAVRVSDGIAPGAAFVPYNQPGLGANTILSGRFITSATLEPAAQEARGR